MNLGFIRGLLASAFILLESSYRDVRKQVLTTGERKATMRPNNCSTDSQDQLLAMGMRSSWTSRLRCATTGLDE